MRRLLVPAVALALCAPLTAAAAPYDQGLSTPVEDVYYPAKGDPTVDSLHYGLDLRWNRRARVLSGRATIELRATRDADAIPLDLSSRLDVSRVTVDGTPATFTHARHHLVVGAPVADDDRYRVVVAYSGTPGPVAGPASRPDVARSGMWVSDDGRLLTTQEPWGALTWYPVNDHPSDKAMYDVTVTTPRTWVGISNGRLASRRTTKRHTVTRWTNTDPMASYLVTLAVGPYERHRQTGPHGLPISYWVPPDRPDLLKPLLRTPQAMRWLEARLGPYPFDRLGVVLIPEGTAMETQTMVTFGTPLYRYGSFYVRATMVHELAHQWYGDTVTPTQWKDLWMNEGMAMYLEKRWESEHSRNRHYDFRAQMRYFARVDQQLRDRYGPPGAYYKDEFGSFNVYSSTALMWNRLRGIVGNRQFNRLVRAWPQTHLNSSADRAMIIAWWEQRTGRELSVFFRRWLSSPRSPA